MFEIACVETYHVLPLYLITLTKTSQQLYDLDDNHGNRLFLRASLDISYRYIIDIYNAASVILF